MTDWTPIAVLPNLSVKRTIEAEIIALVDPTDARVQSFALKYPKFSTFVSRFTDAFRVPLTPGVLIVRDDVASQLANTDAIMSFRDVMVLAVVPYARSLTLVYGGGPRIAYSNSFWLYPWGLARDNEHIVASTPAITALHVVDGFFGQSSPELPVAPLDDVDGPLLEELLRRWKRHYLNGRRNWTDRALFRSLNMATQAAQLPAGIGTTLYDVGRIAALWVSAFEILAHPRIDKSGLRYVYPLLERPAYLDRTVARKNYAAYMNHKKPWPRRNLPCWLYGKLYRARCDFLHGNPILGKPLNPSGSKVSLFMLAAALYRLALTGFLDLSFKRRVPKQGRATAFTRYLDARLRYQENQGIVERALLRVKRS